MLIWGKLKANISYPQIPSFIFHAFELFHKKGKEINQNKKFEVKFFFLSFLFFRFTKEYFSTANVVKMDLHK